MPATLGVLLLLLGSYLLGAVPFALIAGRLKGIDIREHGSGNLGATNAIRVLGKPVGITVFLLDFLKGMGPVLVAGALPLPFPERDLLGIAFACGIAAVLGHIFPVYLKFKGGKGVAATAGALLAIRWEAALTACAAFFLVRELSGYVSLSSMTLALVFPIAIFLYHGSQAVDLYLWITLGSAFLALVIFYRHKSNWVRILRGEEPKVGRKRKLGSTKP
ncbi:MAG: glycerol-3-phosphate 1-O-acyltransferase PlsY [Planctomycetota bacterium]|jgi:glycerol-3-phosphate acyltransferase PlsY